MTPWTVAYQASLSIGFSRQEDWSGLPSPFQEALPNRGIEPYSPALQADSLLFEPREVQKNGSTKKKKKKERERKFLDIFCDILIPSVDNNVKHRWLWF